MKNLAPVVQASAMLLSLFMSLQPAWADGASKVSCDQLTVDISAQFDEIDKLQQDKDHATDPMTLQRIGGQLDEARRIYERNLELKKIYNCGADAN